MTAPAVRGGAGPRLARLLLAAGLAHLVLALASLALPEWGDIAVFRHWAARAADAGVGRAYSSHASAELRYDWPPLYAYLGTAVGGVYRASGLAGRFGLDSPVFALLLKLPMIALNLLVGALLFRLAARLHSDAAVGRWAAVAWLWNPAIALATDVFGYQDALHTSLLVAAAGALVAGSWLRAPSWLALGALAKPQAWIFLVPFTTFLARLAPARDWLRGAVLALLVGLAVLSPFAAAGELGALARAHAAMPSLHPWPSALAHNLWWLLFPAASEDSFASDRRPILLGIDARGLALLLVGGFAAAVAVRLARRPSPDRLLSLSALLAFAFFMLATQAHENHLYAMFPFLTLAAARSPFLRGVLVTLTLTFAANLWLALHWLAAGVPLAPAWRYASLLNALVNLAVLALWTRRALLVPERAPE